jgi:MFS family permease
MLSIFAGNTAIYVVNLAVLQVLLPTQIELLDPARKIETLGMVTGIAAIIAIIANPLAGMLSDKTVSRFGKRTPWLVGGAVAVLGAVAFLAEQTAVFGIVVGMCLLQAAMNSFQAAIFAVVPDRVPPRLRGLASSMMGIAFPVGSVIGTAIAAKMSASPSTYYLLGGLFLAVTLLFVLINPDSSSKRERTRSLNFSATSFFSALGHRDFFWVFFSRLAMVIAFMTLAGYQFYLLKDYINLPEGLSPTDALVQINFFSMLAMAAATLGGGALSDWLGRRRALVFISAACMGIAAIIPFLLPTYQGMLAFGVLNSLGFGCYMAVDAALATEVLPNPNDQARDLGVMNIASAAAQVVSPMIASIVIINFGGYATLLMFSAACAVISAISVCGVKSVR